MFHYLMMRIMHPKDFLQIIRIKLKHHKDFLQLNDSLLKSTLLHLILSVFVCGGEGGEFQKGHPFFSNLLTGFRKNHNTQHFLLKILELWKKALDQVKSVGSILIDLPKAPKP